MLHGERQLHRESTYARTISLNAHCLLSPDHMCLEDLVTDADDKLFNLILYSKHHVLHSILPDRSDFNYNLWRRRHNLVLTAKSSSITDRDYITRMIFKNIYWCWHAYCLPVYMFRFSLLLLCIIVLFIFFLPYVPCLVAVCQRELKSWLIDWLTLPYLSHYTAVYWPIRYKYDTPL